jgi:hypothetical protein
MLVVLVTILYFKSPLSDNIARLFVPSNDSIVTDENLIDENQSDTVNHPKNNTTPTQHTPKLIGTTIQQAYKQAAIHILTILGQTHEP